MRRSETIWILEDDEGTAFVLDEILGIHYQLEFFTTIKDFSERFSQGAKHPNLVIADLKLKDGYFTDFLNAQAEKNQKFSFPFLIISSIDDPSALKFCFKNGALDYLVKPFKKNELAVKVERLLELESEKEEVKALPETRSPKHSEDVISRLEKIKPGLTMKETKITYAFLDSKNNVVTKEDLFLKAWGQTTVSSKSLDVHLSHLRKKLKAININIISIGDGIWEFQQIG